VRRVLPGLLVLIALAPLGGPAAEAQTPPPAARLVLDLQKVGHAKRAVAFAGTSFRVRGQAYPYVAGQSVHVRVFLGKRLILAKTKPILAPAAGTTGQFVADFKTTIHGRMRIGVTHDATPEMGYAHASTEPVDVISGSAYPGQTGFTVRVLQRLLRDVGYVPGHPGVYDDRTARAVLTFRKMSGLARITTAPRTVLRRMIDGGGRFEVRYPDHGHHVEGDISHQVLALIDGDRVERLYPMSSGKPSTPTVLGRFRVYSKQPGTNSHGMVHSSYFIGGYAIHGYADVPAYPASHGCLRVPVPDAFSIFSWIQTGDRVDTYYRTGKHRPVTPSPDAGP